MKPQLGDTVINRYTLVSLLRDEPGLQAWKANDRVLARDCQLYIVTDADAIAKVDAIASSLALSRNRRFTQVLQLQHRGDVSIIITAVDNGLLQQLRWRSLVFLTVCWLKFDPWRAAGRTTALRSMSVSF